MQHNPQRPDLIEAIHDSDLQLSLALSGGGSGLISELLSIPGASQTILEANVPYSKEALTRYLGCHPEAFCSANTSLMLAVQAYFNSLQSHGNQIVAIGGTGALASKTPKKGLHRYFKTIQTRNQTTLVEAILEKGRRTRAEEEILLVELGLSEIGRLINYEYHPFGFTSSDEITRNTIEVSEEWSQVFLRDRGFCLAQRANAERPRGVGILSGSFNPLHYGHLGMAESFSARFGISTHYELAIRNADKPPIDFLTIRDRLLQFTDEAVWLTNAATFVEKSRILPGNIFIVGMDTMERIGNPKYYPESNGLAQVVDELKENDVRFAVFGRHDGQKFATLNDINIDADLKSLCDEIPESDFRSDISSSMLRNPDINNKV